jgi:hypothetical protein
LTPQRDDSAGKVCRDGVVATNAQPALQLDLDAPDLGGEREQAAAGS